MVGRPRTGHPANVARFRRRRDDPYDDYDPYDPYDPRNRGWGRPGRYYGPAPGGSSLRDACLIETGCCIGESLDGNCLVLMLLTGPQLAAVLLPGARRRPVADRLAARSASTSARTARAGRRSAGSPRPAPSTRRRPSRPTA